MSLVRISRPGEPTRFIDCGPAHGRVYGQNYGGSIVIGGRAAPNPAPTPPSAIARATRNKLRRKAEAMGLCGRSIPSGWCARTRGHGYACRSREWLDRRAAAYRAAAKVDMTEREKTPTMVVSSQPNIEVQR